jgi:iron complex outermembrane receptor protein
MVTQAKKQLFTSTFSLLVLAGSLTAAVAVETEAVIETTTPQLEATVVSAPRFIDSDMEIASRVQLIDAEDILESGATDIVQLLQKEANIQFRSTSGNSARSQISMGGFGENSGQRVLILLDGQRLNTADLGQINWLSIPLGLIESVEVIRGGQSALYGNNAVAGVIKISTRRPTEELSGQAQASVGSFDSYNGRVSLTGREGNLGFSVHAEHDETDGYRDNSQYEADGGGLKLDWTHSNWFNAYGSINGVSSDYGLPGPLSRADYKEDPTRSNEGDNEGDEDVIYYRGGAAFCIGDLFTLSMDGGYTDREMTTEFYYTNPLYPFYHLDLDYDIFSLSPVLTYEDEQLTAVFGVDYYDDEVDATSTDLNSKMDYGFTRETLGAFTSFSWRLDQDWTLSGSLRYEDAETQGENGGVDSKTIDDEHAWSLGLIRFLGESSRVYTSVRRFYRYPATDEFVVFSGGIPSINFDLKPETGHEVELGGDTMKGALTLGGRIYYQWMEDEIIYDSSVGLYGSNINLDDTERMGVDLSAGYAITENLDATLSYTWVHSKITDGPYDGSEVPLAPDHLVRLQVQYRPHDTISVTIGASYTDDVYIGGDFANTGNELGDYLLFDLNVRYALTDTIVIFATADNLFDKEYVSTAFSPNGLYPGTGRSGRIGVTWEF